MNIIYMGLHINFLREAVHTIWADIRFLPSMVIEVPHKVTLVKKYFAAEGTRNSRPTSTIHLRPQQAPILQYTDDFFYFVHYINEKKIPSHNL